jgi:hypothetical protein
MSFVHPHPNPSPSMGEGRVRGVHTESQTLLEQNILHFLYIAGIPSQY